MVARWVMELLTDAVIGWMASVRVVKSMWTKVPNIVNPLQSWWDENVFVISFQSSKNRMERT
jgi:hypothetical protein